MSEMTLTLIDGTKALYGRVHWSVVDQTIAALSADPDTIEDLELAIGRYRKRANESPPFAGFSPGLCHQAGVAGLAFIDLPARLVACQTSAFELAHSGTVSFHDGHALTAIQIPCDVSDDWMFLPKLEDWIIHAAERRRQRAAQPVIDVRQVLYHEVASFIVKELYRQRSALLWDKLDSAHQHESMMAIIRGVHAQWLMSPRDDLRGSSPRGMLLARQPHIDSDLQNQATRWSIIDEAPPGIARESWAYNFSGFGLHEIVVYYDFMRSLLHECWERLAGQTTIDFDKETDYLKQFQQEWLHTPEDDFCGMSPIQVTDRERMRLPSASNGHDCLIDDDCPICQAMASGEFGPAFWFLDGSHMDWDFPFSLYTTREEWEIEQPNFEDSESAFGPSTEITANDAVPKNLADLADTNTEFPSSPVWQRSYVTSRLFTSQLEPFSPTVQLLGIGMHLSELIADLRDAHEKNDRIEQLLGAFSDVRLSARDDLTWLLNSNVTLLCERLHAVAETRHNLAQKCDDLCRELELFRDQYSKR